MNCCFGQDTASDILYVFKIKFIYKITPYVKNENSKTYNLLVLDRSVFKKTVIVKYFICRTII